MTQESFHVVDAGGHDWAWIGRRWYVHLDHGWSTAFTCDDLDDGVGRIQDAYGIDARPTIDRSDPEAVARYLLTGYQLGRPVVHPVPF